MRTIFQLLLLLWLLFLSNQTNAAQFEASHLKSVVQNAIQRIKDVDKTKWAFELHSFENEEGEITDYTAEFTAYQCRNNDMRHLSRLHGAQRNLKR